MCPVGIKGTDEKMGLLPFPCSVCHSSAQDHPLPGLGHIFPPPLSPRMEISRIKDGGSDM